MLGRYCDLHYGAQRGPAALPTSLHIAGISKMALDPLGMNRLPDLIRRNAFHTPEKIATHFEGRDVTWAGFQTRMERLAAALAEQGVGKGDRVAYLGLNSHWLVEMYFVPSLIGAIIVPMNHRLSESEMVDLLLDCTPKAIVVDRHFAARAETLFARCASLHTLIYADWDPAASSRPEGALDYETLAQDDSLGPHAAFEDASASGDTFALFYTSGTTGVPKGVMLSHDNFLANAMGTAPLYGLSHEDVVMLAGPLFHVATGSRVFSSVLYGTTIVVQAKFEIEGLMTLIEAQKVTTMTLVPTMCQMILDHPRFEAFDTTSLRCITYGSAPMPIGLMRRLIEELPGVTFCQGYGMTEAAPVICILGPEDHISPDGTFPKLASLGKPMTYCDIRIANADGHPVPQGQTGEITVRGPQVMKGYWNRPEETQAVMKDGFYHTGDAGYLDADGYVFLAGRTKEMIISGGENVYPIETENCLSKHPAVAASAVIGLPHERWGEMVCAAVRLKDGADVSAEDLIAHCRAHIAHYKAPKQVLIWPEDLPLNPANKIDKAKIKEVLGAKKPL